MMKGTVKMVLVALVVVSAVLLLWPRPPGPGPLPVGAAAEAKTESAPQRIIVGGPTVATGSQDGVLEFDGSDALQYDGVIEFDGVIEVDGEPHWPGKVPP